MKRNNGETTVKLLLYYCHLWTILTHFWISKYEWCLSCIKNNISNSQLVSNFRTNGWGLYMCISFWLIKLFCTFPFCLWKAKNILNSELHNTVFSFFNVIYWRSKVTFHLVWQLVIEIRADSRVFTTGIGISHSSQYHLSINQSLINSRRSILSSRRLCIA